MDAELNMLLVMETVLNQNNKEVFNTIVKNIPVIIGIITVVIALIMLNTIIYQKISGEPASYYFEISTLVSFIGFSALQIFSHTFADYQTLPLERIINLNGIVFGVCLISTLINYLFGHGEEK